MKRIRVWASLTNYNTEQVTFIEVPDDATSEQIEDEATEAAAELYSWGWEEVNFHGFNSADLTTMEDNKQK